MERFTVTLVTSLICICLFANSGLSAEFLEKNAVGIWLFDEGKGDVVKDSGSVSDLFILKYLTQRR